MTHKLLTGIPFSEIHYLIFFLLNLFFIAYLFYLLTTFSFFISVHLESLNPDLFQKYWDNFCRK